MRGARFCKLVLMLFIVQSEADAGLSPADSLDIARKASQAYRIFLNDPDSSILLAGQALTRAQSAGYMHLEGFSSFTLSKAHWARGNFRLSIEYGFKALMIYEQTTEVFYLGESCLALARTFIDLKNYAQARHYLNRALQLAEEHTNDDLLAHVCREYSMLLSEIHEYDSALTMADRSLAIYRQSQDTLNTSIVYSRKAKIHFLKGDHHTSNLFNLKARMLDSLVGNRRSMGIGYMQAGQNAFAMNKPDSAIYFLKKSIPINASVKNFNALVRIHELMAKIYTEQRKTSLALDQLNLALQYKDSLYHAEKAGQILEMQSLYELEGKNRTIDMLNKENAIQERQVQNQRIVTALLSIGIILLITLLAVLARLRLIQNRANRELKSKTEDIALQKEEIQSQAENLQHLNDLKSKLFSVVSHDLRGPIASLHSLLELLTNKQLSETEFVLFVGKLKSNIGVTQRTLENLLNWSLSQMEGIKTDPQVVDVKMLVEDACRLLEEVAGRKNISLNNKVSDSTHVLVDPNQLHLILRNLLHNAIKFSKTNQEVWVSATCTTTFCILKVKDSGIGMNRDEINLITGSEHFTKVGTQQEKGTGLGLLLCKEFIKRNGGTLEIDSTEGEGTEVRISLPIAR